MNNNTLLTVNQLSELLQVPLSRVYNMVFRKEIPYYKLGRSVRFGRNDLDRYFQQIKTEAKSI